jgi:hypothetical protein
VGPAVRPVRRTRQFDGGRAGDPAARTQVPTPGVPLRQELRTSGCKRLGLDLVDVTYTGATTANVLAETQHGAPPQVGALDGSEVLVTVMIGGNDVGYVPC